MGAKIFSAWEVIALTLTMAISGFILGLAISL